MWEGEGVLMRCGGLLIFKCGAVGSSVPIFFCRLSGVNICIFGSFDLTACLENERRISGVDRQGLFSAGVKQR